MQRANSIFDSESETRMFHQIAAILPEGYRLLPQVPLRSFVNNWIYDNLPFPHKRWLCQCSVDYAVCIDNVYLTPLIPIEYDGYTNGQTFGSEFLTLDLSDEARERKKKFEFKLDTLAKVGYPLQVFPGDINYSDSALVRQLTYSAYACCDPNDEDDDNEYFRLANRLLSRETCLFTQPTPPHLLTNKN